MPLSSDRHPALDGLRGVALLCVLAAHAGLPLFGGSLIMFVLSGFLITSLLIREHDRTGRIAVGTFYRRRAQRLMPALGVMLLAVNLIVLVMRPADAPDLRRDTLYVLVYISNWAQITHHSPLLAHLWSLSLQEQCYLLWPVMGHVLRRSRRQLLTACLLLALVSAALRGALVLTGASRTVVYLGTLTRLDGVLLGSALAVAVSLPAYGHWVRWAQHHRVAVEGLSVVAALVMGACLMLYTLNDPGTYLIGMPLISMCTASLIATCLLPQRGLLARLLAGRIRVLGMAGTCAIAGVSL